jgi:hypothetical protein
MGRFRYTFDVLTNRKTFRDLREDSPLRKLLETVRSELSERDKDIADEIGSGDDVEKHFKGTLAHPAVKPGSLVIHAVVVGGGTETFTDNGDGTLKSDASPPGTGTIDYTHGSFDVTFNAPPKNGENVYADYTSFLEFVSYGLNKVYDVRFIQYACGDDLDRWGETLGLPRPTTGEPPQYVTDGVYRDALLAELRDFTASLTAEAIKKRVNEIEGGIGYAPEIIELYTFAPDWPIEWDDVDAPYTTWVPWDNLVDFLLVLTSEPTAEKLEKTVSAVQETKFAPARCFIVTANLGGYYDLVRTVE